MKDFKRELILCVGTILIIIVIVLSFISCQIELSVDECYCIKKTTTEKISIINGIPRTTYKTTSEEWGNDCSDDGMKFENSIIICN